MKIEIQHAKLIGYNKSSSKREIYSDKCLHEETRKASNNLTFTLQGTRKDKQMKPKVNRRKAITNITVEINEIETKNSIEKNNEIKSFSKKNKS